MNVKNINLLIVLFLIAMSLQTFGQEIPNGGFENWSGTTVTGWVHNGTSFFPTVTQTTDAFSGNFAAYGEVVNFSGTLFPPVIFTGSLGSPFFSVSVNPGSFTGQYKFESQGEDVLFIEVVLVNLSVGGGGEGNAEITADATSYQSLNIPIVYDDDNPPGWQATEASITVAIEPPTGQVPHSGTNFTIDHFSFDGNPLDVKEVGNGLIPGEFELHQNYPNPFNPTTFIEFSIPGSGFVSLHVYNMLGEKVATLVNEHLSSGSYSADFNSENLTSGTYIYRLTTNDFSESRKMILLK